MKRGHYKPRRPGHYGRLKGEGNYGLMPLAEVAARLGWSLPAVESLWQRGIRKMRKEPDIVWWVRALVREQNREWMGRN